MVAKWWTDSHQRVEVECVLHGVWETSDHAGREAE